MPTKLYRTKRGILLEQDGRWSMLASTNWEELFNTDDLHRTLSQAKKSDATEPSPSDLVAPISQQEVWAAGVTYFRSRTARMEESKEAGGGSFYDRVYNADRPELFFKATPHRVVGQNGVVRIRKDSKWNVPEPELVLVVNTKGKIIGYSVGNDMSSRDIEGENPLYLPQAKVYDACCGLGPCILLSDEPLPPTTEIKLEIRRGASVAFSGSTNLSQLKREPKSLVEFLYRESTFPHGSFLFTGTGIIPPDEFTLQKGDEIRITIEPIGTLINHVG